MVRQSPEQRAGLIAHPASRTPRGVRCANFAEFTGRTQPFSALVKSHARALPKRWLDLLQPEGWRKRPRFGLARVSKR